MGATATIVTALAWYTVQYVQYNPDSTTLTQTAYVLGGQFGFSITAGVSGDTAILFNSTYGNTGRVGLTNCTLVNGACVTPKTLIMGGSPYSYEVFYILEDQSSGSVDANISLSVFVLPPVPSQVPFPSYTLGAAPALTWVASNYSQEYGNPLIGCVLAWGVHPYLATDMPASLTGGQSLPSNMQGTFGVAQTAVTSYPLSALSLTAGSVYDFHYRCYNAMGPSPDTAVYSFVGALGTPAPPTSVVVNAPDNATLYVTWTTPQFTGDVGPLVNSTFRSCTIQVGPRGFQPGATTPYYKFTSGRIKVSSTTTLTVRGGFNLAVTPVVDVVVSCNNSQLTSSQVRQSSTGLLLPPSNAPQLVYHDAEWAAPFRLVPNCAIDVHAVLARSSTPTLYQMGGYTSPSIDVTTTGSFDEGNFQTISPTFGSYNGTTNFLPYTPAARFGAGAAVLPNGNVIWFGGQ